MNPQSSIDFFISYNRHDRAFAEWIAWILEAEGFSVVIQAWDFDYGGNFVLDMQKAAANAERTIAVLSRNSLESGFVQAEWAAAFAKDPMGMERRLIPIRVGDCELKGLWAQIVYLDLVGVEAASAEELVIQAAKRAVTKARSKPAEKPKFPTSDAPSKPLYPPSVPQNLPFENAVFVGRETDLEELHKQLQESQTVSIMSIRGMGGIGKTELALQYAVRSRNAGLYPGGLCWINAISGVGLELITFARTYLGIEPPDALDLAGRVAFCLRSWQPGEVLIVIDNVEEYDAIAQLFRGMESRFKVLLTTRKQFGSAVREYAIEVLSEAASLELLRSIVGEVRIDAELAAAKRVCEWLGYLPLGLELVGRYLARRLDTSVGQLEGRLREKSLAARALLKAEPGMRASLGVTAAFELSWQELEADAQDLAKGLGGFAAAAMQWEWVVACCAGTDEEELEELRDEALLGAHLVTRIDLGVYEVHPLLREFFRSKMSQEEREQIKTAVATVMIEIAKQIPYTPTLEEIGAVTAAIPHLQAVAEDLMQVKSRNECGIADDDDLTWVFTGISRFYEGQGLYADAEPWSVACLAVARSLLGENHPDVAGRYEQAEPLYIQALELRRSLLGENHPDVATSLNNLAGLYRSQGRYEQAEPLYIQALQLCRSLLGENHPDVATSLNNLALLYESQGRYEQAEPLFIQALQLRRSLLGENHPHVASSLNNLAGLYESQGRYEQAEPLYIQALQLCRSLLGENHPHVASSLNNLAELYRSQGRYEQAEPLYIQALELRRSLLGENHPHVASSLNNLALLYKSQGRYEQAEPLYIQALQIDQEALGQEHPDFAIDLSNLAGLYTTLDRYAEAEPLYLQAIATFYDRLGEAHPYTQQTWEAFINLLVQVRQSDRTSELSDHPTTQSILQQLQSASE